LVAQFEKLCRSQQNGRQRSRADLAPGHSFIGTELADARVGVREPERVRLLALASSRLPPISLKNCVAAIQLLTPTTQVALRYGIFLCGRIAGASLDSSL
jgi:hypothetical protein